MAVNVTQIRDTKWLTLEVCREFQRGTCSRPDSECKFAHPAKSCQVENGRVIACFDSLKVSMTNVRQPHSSPSRLAILGFRPAVLTSDGFRRFLVQQELCQTYIEDVSAVEQVGDRNPVSSRVCLCSYLQVPNTPSEDIWSGPHKNEGLFEG